jgi:hypothetical protein
METLEQLIDGVFFPTLDRFLTTCGLERRGYEYLRRTTEASQKLVIALEYHPTYHSNALVHIKPVVVISMPAVNKLALEMVRDPWLLANAPQITLSQPIDTLVPSEKRLQWYVYRSEEIKAVSESLGEFVKQWVIPFLEEYQTPRDIIAHYEQQDPRPLGQRHWYVYVSASYLLINDTANAKKVLEKHLGTAGMRKRFANAFNYFKDCRTY